MFEKAEIEAGLEARGVKIVNKGDRPASRPRMIRTTYYAYGSYPAHDTIVKTTRGVWPDYAARSAFYALSQNKYGAGVVEIVDEDNFHELCTVLTRSVDGNIKVVFKRDPKRPKLVLPG